MDIQLSVQQWLNSGEPPEGIQRPFPSHGDITFGLVTYDSEQDVFCIMEDSFGDTYDIDAGRILTAAAFADWMWQLHHKRWITPQHLKDLMDCLCCYIYREHNGQFPQSFYQVEGAIMRGPDEV
jgi:hypothetical protein